MRQWFSRSWSSRDLGGDLADMDKVLKAEPVRDDRYEIEELFGLRPARRFIAPGTECWISR